MKRLLILILLLVGCKGKYIGLPETRIVSGPLNGSIVHTNTIKFVWEGNEFTKEYKHCIDSMWSEWTDAESITLILDEGWHTFSVCGRNILGEVENTYPKTTFLVDGLVNGFSIAPLVDTVSITEHFTVMLRSELPTPHRYEYFLIKWERARLEFVNILFDSTSYSMNAYPVIVPKIYEDSVEIFISMLGADFPSQDRIICTIEFNPLNYGECEIVLHGEIFDSTGVTIPLDTLQGGKIVVY